MQLEQFLRGMTLTGRTTVQSPANLRLPFRIIFGGSPPQVLRQFQTLLRRQILHSLFDLGNAHGTNNAESRPFFNLFYRKCECAPSPGSPATRAATARGQLGRGETWLAGLLGQTPGESCGVAGLRAEQDRERMQRFLPRQKPAWAATRRRAKTIRPKIRSATGQTARRRLERVLISSADAA